MGPRKAAAAEHAAGVPRLDERPVLNGIFLVLRSCQIPFAEEKKTKISPAHALAVTKTQLAQWFCAAGTGFFIF
jgi:hypothetical protein